KQKSRRPKEKDTQIPQSSVPSDPTNIADEAVTEEPNIYLVNVDKDEDMFVVNDLEGDEVTLAQALAALKSAKVQEKSDVIKEPSVPVSVASTKVSTVIPTTAATTITTVSSRPREKGIVFHEQEQEQEQAPTLIVSSQQPTHVKDKGKGKMIEEEPVKKISKKELLKLDEEPSFKLQAEEDEEEKLAREKAQKVEEANIAWDDIQAKVEADYQKEENSLQLKEQRKIGTNHLLKLNKELFDKAIKRVNTFVDIDTELVKESSKNAEAEITQESSSKRAREALEQEISKKQKVDDDKETKELKQCMEIISDDGDDVTIKVIPLSTKSPTISIVKSRFKKTKPVNYMDIFLHLNLKTMFEHHLEDSIWKNQQGLVKVLIWKLYDSYGVHCVTMQNILYYLLVEKMYPLTKHTLHQMFNDVKLQVDYECKTEFKLLRLVKKQLKKGYVPQ
ncbi:hypothetical protein Tco_1415294, partial [Tanacetum coccineum]